MLDEKSVDAKVNFKMLIESLGINEQSFTSCKYIIYAIELVMSNPIYLNQNRSSLTRIVAEYFGVSISTVTGCIRGCYNKCQIQSQFLYGKQAFKDVESYTDMFKEMYFYKFIKEPEKVVDVKANFENLLIRLDINKEDDVSCKYAIYAIEIAMTDLKYFDRQKSPLTKTVAAHFGVSISNVINCIRACYNKCQSQSKLLYGKPVFKEFEEYTLIFREMFFYAKQNE